MLILLVLIHSDFYPKKKNVDITVQKIFFGFKSPTIRCDLNKSIDIFEE